MSDTLTCDIDSPLLAALFGELSTTAPYHVKSIELEEMTDLWLVKVFGTSDRDQLAEYHADEIIAIDAFAEALHGMASEVSEGGDVTVTGLDVAVGGEHSYGIAYFYDSTNVEEFCQAYGISYRMWDDGKYEIPGEEREYRADRDRIFFRGHSAEGTVMSHNDVERLYKDADGDPAVFTRLVHQYFDPDWTND